MPFDGTLASHLLARARLIEVLRNPPPDRPHWDFTRVCNCAFYDCESLGIDHLELGLTQRQIEDIFGVMQDPSFYGVARMSDVTPEMVAAAIESLPA